MALARNAEISLDNPFPGMNPYLESARLWPEVHNCLVASIHSWLRRTLPFRYWVIMGERAGIGIHPPPVPPYRYIKPDLGITDADAVAVLVPFRETVSEWYITISDQNSDELVTILELLSPSNKRSGEGRIQYEDKRHSIFESATHLVEIDLVRQGPPMPAQGYDGDAPYRILVSRGPSRPAAVLYPFGLQSPIPDVAVPLLAGDAEPKIPLNELLHNLYREDYYANYVDYGADPEGPLSVADRAWLDGLLREKGLRR